MDLSAHVLGIYIGERSPATFPNCQMLLSQQIGRGPVRYRLICVGVESPLPSRHIHLCSGDLMTAAQDKGRCLPTCTYFRAAPIWWVWADPTEFAHHGL